MGLNQCEARSTSEVSTCVQSIGSTQKSHSKDRLPMLGILQTYSVTSICHLLTLRSIKESQRPHGKGNFGLANKPTIVIIQLLDESQAYVSATLNLFTLLNLQFNTNVPHNLHFSPAFLHKLHLSPIHHNCPLLLKPTKIYSIACSISPSYQNQMQPTSNEELTTQPNCISS